jgi:NAD(P)-dependent dehydrogenase (short-subunit alcohol dehydrogenase family)
MADEQFCRRVVEETLGQWGEIYCLINNAFAFTSKGLDATSADSGRVLEVGPIAYAVMAQCVAEPMKQQGGEAAVNVLGISAFIAQPHRWTYNAAKGRCISSLTVWLWIRLPTGSGLTVLAPDGYGLARTTERLVVIALDGNLSGDNSTCSVRKACGTRRRYSLPIE